MSTPDLEDWIPEDALTPLIEDVTAITHSGHDVWTSPTEAPITIKPSSAPPPGTILFDMQATGAGVTNFSIDSEGDVVAHSLVTPAATITALTTSSNLSVFGATTSAQLAGVITDETGSGALVFGTGPTIDTPTIYTPIIRDGITLFSNGASPALLFFSALPSVYKGAIGLVEVNGDLALGSLVGDVVITASPIAAHRILLTPKPSEAPSLTLGTGGYVGLGGRVHYDTLPGVYANNAAALAGGLVAGDTYRSGGDPDVLCIVH